VSGQDAATRQLSGLLEATHAAVYGYGVLGARLDAAARPRAQAAVGAHRARRDRLGALLRARGAEPPDPAVAYEAAVSGQADALALAVRLEEGLSVRWRDLVAVTDDRPLRRLAVDGLTETAVRAASWRVLLGSGPPTVAAPGAA
jgi:hypothetical protein